MTLPAVTGIIRRRVLVNYRVDPDVVARILPAPFRPLTHDGNAIAGVCLIKLEHIRPNGFPAIIGISSENAAHRFAVEWTDPDGNVKQGVYIPKRCTDSAFNRLAGGRLFPGEQEPASFKVSEIGPGIDFKMHSAVSDTTVEFTGTADQLLPEGSCFDSVKDASRFFESGSIGFSVRSKGSDLDGLKLETFDWQVEPLSIVRLRASYFEDPERFPRGSITFDHALIMRDLRHEWRSVERLKTETVGAS